MASQKQIVASIEQLAINSSEADQSQPKINNFYYWFILEIFVSN